jgi:hypothetical protein
VIRATEGLRSVAIVLWVAALVVLGTALVLERSTLVAASLIAVAAIYAAQLSIDDTTLDPAAAAVAAGLLVAAELAYWSIEERDAIRSEAGEALRHAALVGFFGLGALGVGSVLLALADGVEATGFIVDLAGAAAAVGVLLALVAVARGLVRRI